MQLKPTGQLLVTKHCRPEVRAFMLNGHFRIGTTIGYSKVEAGGLLQDGEEGHASFELLGSQTIHELAIPGANLILKGLTVEGARAAVSVGFVADFHAFCASNGGYSEARHRTLLNGTEFYERNEGLTAYVVLDKLKLAAAIEAAALASTEPSVNVIGRSVAYGERALGTVSQSTFVAADFSARAAFKAAFVKPVKFAPEEEFRFLVHGDNLPAVPLDRIDTVQLSTEIQRQFRDTIIEAGEL